MKTYPPGTRIAGRYEIAGRPLMGGMGIVYICLDTETDRPVALKTFRPEFLPDRAARDRFLREGTVWVDLGAHPHVVRCYQVFKLNVRDEVYLVLELVGKEPGREDASLRSWLAPGQPLPVEQTLLFALQIARGMKHATDVIPGFVHRDLKPENVLVGADHLSGAPTNRLRVTDFGLATILQEAAPHITKTASDTQHGTRNKQHAIRNTQLTHGAVGTPLYMAPEQWQRQPVTAATDVYALGCILYEMLAGQRAVPAHSLTALQRVHCAGQVRPLPEGLSATVGQIVTRCLAVELGERYRDWGQVEAALAAAYEDLADRPAPQPEPAALVSRAQRVAAGWSYSEMGASYLYIGKAEVAAGYFERAQEVGSAEGEQELEGTALNNLGEVYRNLGDAHRAIGYYEQALAIAIEIGDRRGEGNALGNLGIAYFQLGDARRVIQFCEQALVIRREIGDRRGQGIDLGNLGLAYAALGNARRAIGYYEQQLVVTREIGDRRGDGNALGNLGSAYLQLGDARRAVGYYEQALEIALEIGDRRGQGTDLNNLGEAYRNLGDAHRAIGYYEQALAIAIEIGDRLGEGNALGNLGTACAALGGARRAIGYYEQQLVITREIGDRRGESNALMGLGIAYADLGDVQRAIEHEEQALEIYREIGDVLTAAMLSANLAMSLSQVGQVDRATSLIEQAIRDFRQAGYSQQAQQAERMLARIRGGGA